MFRLFPRDENFFDLFEKAAANVHEGAKLLVDLLENYTDLENKARHIKNVEHAGDELTHHTMERLNKTFITPLDREDIHELTSRLDDVLDLIDNAVHRMMIYKIAQPTDDARALARVIEQSSSVVERAVGMLRNMKDGEAILRACIEAHALENEGDRIQHHALGELFENARDPIEVIKWKDVYQALEAASDRCEDVANVLEGIVLKNA
ncbi:MAG: DUF47 domain-containing protein [Planctomycetes bacterium]|nr:DUF47 domain-containing protein [Planctomycetota bacterium]